MELLSLLISIEIAVIILTLLSASYQDMMIRRVKNITWLPIIVFCAPVSAINCILLYQTDSFLTSLYLISAFWFALLAYLAARVHIFGGADAIALILISVCVPVCPFAPVVTIPGLTQVFVFPVVVYFNAVILSAAVPLYLLIRNNHLREKTPFMTRCTCVPFNSEDGSVMWKKYPVPFIVPITLGFVLALMGI